jgi:hypothetical protein
LGVTVRLDEICSAILNFQCLDLKNTDCLLLQYV